MLSSHQDAYLVAVPASLPWQKMPAAAGRLALLMYRSKGPKPDLIRFEVMSMQYTMSEIQTFILAGGCAQRIFRQRRCGSAILNFRHMCQTTHVSCQLPALKVRGFPTVTNSPSTCPISNVHSSHALNHVNA